MATEKNTKKPEAEEQKPVTPVIAPAPTAPVASKGKSILIVEDEKPLSHALEMKLTKVGYTTKVVMNGQDALAALKAGKFDLVMMDLIMPIMDGFELLKEIKDAGVKVPAIVLSNLGQEEDRKKASELGAIDYFVKANTPISEIVARAEKALS
ncbi:MAG: response regulator [Candidatus Peribacteraceae bacterium]